MHSLARDFTQALRSFKKNPGFSAIVVMTLALGIGANAAVFTMIDVLIYRPFPIPKISELVIVWGTSPTADWQRDGVAPGVYLEWEAQQQSFDAFIASHWWDVNITGETPERAQGTRVTPGFLSVLGVEPGHGRLFATQDGSVDATDVAIVSHRLWTRRYGADQSLVGRTIVLNGRAHEVIGITPDGFNYPQGSDIWAPLKFDSQTADSFDRNYLEVMGHLKSGVSVSEATSEMELLARRSEQAHPNDQRGRGVLVQELRRAVIDIGMPTLLGLWQSTVVFVLLIACANIANLLLARGLDRTGELALLQALGASRWRILRQLLTENLALAGLGAIASIPFSWIALEGLRNNLPTQIQRFVMGWERISLNPRVLLMTALAAGLTSILFGLIPAWLASRPNLVGALKAGSRSSGGRSQSRGRSTLVAGEIALALMLLVAAGLTIQGTLETIHKNNGYDPQGILSAELTLADQEYEQPESIRQFYEQSLAEIRQIPGITSADAINIIPSGDSNSSRQYETLTNPVDTLSERPFAGYRIVTPGALDTLRIPLLSGRRFDSRDRADTALAAIVSESMARTAWPAGDALGEQFRFRTQSEDYVATVVGVAGNVTHNWFMGERPTFYLPLSQQTRPGMHLVIRTTGDPTESVDGLREAIMRVDANQPIYNVRPLADVHADRVIGLHYMATVMSVFGALALILAAVGIYGLMSYNVVQRRHEIGVRMALGADTADVVKLAIAKAVRLTLIGSLIGAPLAWAAGRVMESQVFGVIRLDWGTFAVFSMALVAVSLLAGYVPARRAAAINPTEALRPD